VVKEKTQEGIEAIKDFIEKKKEEFAKKTQENSPEEEKKIILPGRRGSDQYSPKFDLFISGPDKKRRGIRSHRRPEGL